MDYNKFCQGYIFINNVFGANVLIHNSHEKEDHIK